MTADQTLPPALAKEVRALLPTFCAVLAAIVVGSFGGGQSTIASFTLIGLGLLGFAFGTIALGAQSFGHEYSHRTLGLLLAQPMDRRRLFLYKLAVLSAMLVTLTAVTLVRFQGPLQRAASPHTEPSMLIVAAACGLFVAPWLTMLCHSTLAGIVFTIAIPGLLATGADVVGGLIYGLQNGAAIDHFKFVVFWRGMFLICVLSSIAGWRTFMRLEVIDGHGAEVHFPDALSFNPASADRSPARRHHPLWALVTKELHLQQITFVVAGLFVLTCLGMAWMERARPESANLPAISVTVLYAGILTMLTGSLASAEERHLGTAEWQTLLPVAAWRQWLVKVAVVLGMVLVLGGALPALLGYVMPVRERFVPGMVRQLTLMMLLLAAGSLYVSSLCKSGVAALVMSFPVVLATVLWVRAVEQLVSRFVRPLLKYSVDGRDIFLLVMLVGGGLVALLLWLGFRNHRSGDRSVARSSQQALAIASYITVGLAVLVALGLR